MTQFSRETIIMTMIGLFTFIILIIMAVTNSGFIIINDGSRGIKKSGTEYEMVTVKPGYHFFIPWYSSIDVQTVRPILVNYSVSEAERQDQELLIFESPLKGLDNKGIPISLAISIEVKPNADKLPLMYKEDGDFENAFYKKVLQANREAVQSTISQFEVDTIMAKRTEVEKVLTTLLNTSYARNPYFSLVGINLKDIIVPQEISVKQLAVQSAKQEALKAAELIVKAENEAKAIAAVAQGAANARLIEAESTAKSNEIVAKSLTSNIITIERIKKWDGSVPKFVGSENSKFIFQTDTK